MILYTLLLSVACLLAGAVVHILAPEGPIATTLIIAGMSGTGAAGLLHVYVRNPGRKR